MLRSVAKKATEMSVRHFATATQGGTYYGEPEYDRGSGNDGERYYFVDVSNLEYRRRVKQPKPKIVPLPKPTEKER
ncbi:hypothetical protein ACHWQZ_G004614 [Mnemiopsis leidyi]